MKSHRFIKTIFLVIGATTTLAMTDRFLTWRFIQSYSEKPKTEAISDLCADGRVKYMQIEAAHEDVIVCKSPHRVLRVRNQPQLVSVSIMTIIPMLGYSVFVDFKYDDEKLISTEVIRQGGGI